MSSGSSSKRVSHGWGCLRIQLSFAGRKELWKLFSECWRHRDFQGKTAHRAMIGSYRGSPRFSRSFCSLAVPFARCPPFSLQNLPQFALLQRQHQTLQLSSPSQTNCRSSCNCSHPHRPPLICSATLSASLPALSALSLPPAGS